MPTIAAASPVGLPPHFVQAMRILFDIMDVDRTGRIKFTDFARKWQHLPPAAPNVPPGFLESLRKVAPPNGLLTFERFCQGLQLALAEQNGHYVAPKSAHRCSNGRSRRRENGHPPLQRVKSDGNLAEEYGNYSKNPYRAPSPPSSSLEKSHKQKNMPMGVMAARMDGRRGSHIKVRRGTPLD